MRGASRICVLNHHFSCKQCLSAYLECNEPSRLSTISVWPSGGSGSRSCTLHSKFGNQSSFLPVGSTSDERSSDRPTGTLKQHHRQTPTNSSSISRPRLSHWRALFGSHAPARPPGNHRRPPGATVSQRRADDRRRRGIFFFRSFFQRKNSVLGSSLVE